jgi:hypothetical protein
VTFHHVHQIKGSKADFSEQSESEQNEAHSLQLQHNSSSINSNQNSLQNNQQAPQPLQNSTKTDSIQNQLPNHEAQQTVDSHTNAQTEPGDYQIATVVGITTQKSADDTIDGQQALQVSDVSLQLNNVPDQKSNDELQNLSEMLKKVLTKDKVAVPEQTPTSIIEPLTATESIVTVQQPFVQQPSATNVSTQPQTQIPVQAQIQTQVETQTQAQGLPQLNQQQIANILPTVCELSEILSRRSSIEVKDMGTNTSPANRKIPIEEQQASLEKKLTINAEIIPTDDKEDKIGRFTISNEPIQNEQIVSTSTSVSSRLKLKRKIIL